MRHSSGEGERRPRGEGGLDGGEPILPAPSPLSPPPLAAR